MRDALAELTDRVHQDLHMIRFPEREWVVPASHPTGAHVYDVVVVGAGQCGLAVSFALLRRRITNIQVYEANEPGRQGPWRTYGRMLTLRSAKHMNGPDLDIPSLTLESWYKARYGEQAWDSVDKIACGDWQDYLLWFRRAADIPVRYQTRVESVEPDDSGLLRLTITGDGTTRTEYARKVVLATGVEGCGRWVVPPLISDALPADRYSQIAQEIDFAALSGRRVGVLGGGASAYDNAAVALEHGAAEVHVFFRRPQLHRVNPHHWSQFAGFLEHLRDLPDEWRWKFMTRTMVMNEPPPPETFRRCIRHRNFVLHLGETWDQVGLKGDDIAVTTAKDDYLFDHLFVAVGLVQDIALQRELTGLEPHITRWADRYTPPSGEQNDGLARFPYLGPNFEYTERTPGAAPCLADIYNFTAAATLSHGPSGSSIQGMKQAAQRLATGICRDLFVGAVTTHYADFLAWETLELDVPWPPQPAESGAELDI